ncbi:MAG TPA: peptidase C39 family protein [Marmoricola sp.]|nr:peptidase C39 family protein [Marmoricola sp.]
MRRRLAALASLGIASVVATAGTLGPAAFGSTTDGARVPAAHQQAQLRATPQTPIRYVQWDTRHRLRQGHLAGLRIAHGRLRIATPVGTRRYRQASGRVRAYELGRWTSPWTRPGNGATQLVASWSATTPRNTWIQVQVRGIDSAGHRSSWDTLAHWAQSDMHVERTSLRAQRDDLAHVATDTWIANGTEQITSWQLRATLYRRAGTATSPRLDTIGAMTSALPADPGAIAPSPTTMTHRVVLPVPEYSQMIHAGQYSQWGGGGEAWCSPTSTSMVLGYYDALPPAASYPWVDSRYRDPWVDAAARATFDYRYDGTGNWPFNTAFAANRTGHAFVTRLRSLREAEQLIEAGIPVVASIAFGPGELKGAPISSTAGHLVVIVGFRANGNPVVNDPAARRDRWVRRTYDRAQFERAWLNGSGGLAYVITDGAHPLPGPRRASNW